MEQYDLFLRIVQDFRRTFKISQWTDSRIKSEFGRRSISQIMNSREIPKAGCFEQGLVIRYMSANQGIDVNLVMMGITRPYYGTRIRAAIEPQLDEQRYVFHPNEKSDILKKGTMPYKRTHRIFPKKILRAEMTTDTDKSWLDFFGINNINEIEKIFP